MPPCTPCWPLPDRPCPECLGSTSLAGGGHEETGAGVLRPVALFANFVENLPPAAVGTWITTDGSQQVAGQVSHILAVRVPCGSSCGSVTTVMVTQSMDRPPAFGREACYRVGPGFFPIGIIGVPPEPGFRNAGFLLHQEGLPDSLVHHIPASEAGAVFRHY